MKKIVCLLLCLLLALGLSACNVTVSSEDQNNGSGSQDKKAEEIDLDLTELSSTMVYSEVYNMVIEPDSFVGERIKMKGTFVYATDDVSGKTYYACIIKDATACCSQGLEFETTDEFRFPDDFPEYGEDVTVIGTFDYYDEDHYRYLVLRNAKVVE